MKQRQSCLRSALAASLLFALVHPPAAAALTAAQLDRDRRREEDPRAVPVVIERIEATSQVWVDRALLRETLRPVELDLAVADRETGTAVVRWREGEAVESLAEHAAARGPAGRWFSYTRDGGKTWSEPALLDTALTLRGAALEPGEPMPSVSADLALPVGGRLFVLQFQAVALPEWRESLAQAGIELIQHVPHHAFIARMDPGQVDAAAALPFVARVEPYHPGYRLDPAVERWLHEKGNDKEQVGLRVVIARGGEARDRVNKAIDTLGGRVGELSSEGTVLNVWLNRSALRAVAALDDVLWIDPIGEFSTDMDLVRQDDGANWLESGLLTGWCGQGVRAEVLDEGFQLNHPDFDGILTHGPTDTSVPTHGTSVYGIVFGNGNRDGDGNAQGTGILPCAAGIASGQGFANCFMDRYTHTQQLKATPYFASFQTNSWGCDSIANTYNSYSQEMDNIVWNLDIAILQSQGNTGLQGTSRSHAIAKNVISVGGIKHQNTLSTTDDQWVGGSTAASYGPASDGRIKPDVSYWYDSIFTTAAGSTYTSVFGGTSAATPQSAGVLGLIAQMWSENVWKTNPTGTTVFQKLPHASTLKALLVNSSQQYPFSGTSHDLRRTRQGWGRPSAQIAKNRAARSLVVDHGVPLALNQFATYQVDVEPGENELRVTMVYPDPPALPGASVHRINDLNLKVTSPSGTIYYGNNGLLAGTTSTSGGSPNTVDTVENVLLANPTVGRWTVEVRAAQINQDAYLATGTADAVFSLVVTGARRAPVDNYYPTSNAVSHLASGIANCMGTGMSCQILRDEDVLPLAPTTDIVMHGGGSTGSCQLTGYRCNLPDQDVYINDPGWTWPAWCLANGEAYTLNNVDRYDMRGVSVSGCAALPFQFTYNYKCTSNAQCLTGHQCNTGTGVCFDPCFDLDNDTWTICEGDCNDADPWVNPGQQEVCGNGYDDDCDGNYDSECCTTFNLPNHQCVMCENSNDYVCGPGYQQLCCY